MPFMGIQFLPGAPSDPTQAEAPSLPELLGTLAGNIYGGDPRYSAAAGIGSGFSDIFSGMRTKRDEVRQFQQLKKLFPDMPLVPGMKPPTFKELSDLQSQKQSDQQLQVLMKQLAQPEPGPTPVGGGVLPVRAPLMTPQQGLQYGQITGKYPPQWAIKGVGGGEGVKQWQGIAADAGLYDQAGQPRAPQTVQEWDRYNKSQARMTAGLSATKAGLDEAAKLYARQRQQGVMPELKKSTPTPASLLTEWVDDPSSIKPGDPMIGEAREAAAMYATRAKRSKESADIYDSANKALEILPKVVQEADNLKGKYSDFALGQYADLYEAIQTPEKGIQAKAERAAGQLMGIPSDLKRYFNLVGSLRNTLMKAYAAQIPSRAASFIKGTQIHVPAMRTSLADVVGNAQQVRDNLLQAKRYADPRGDPERGARIKFYMEKYGFKRSYAEYRVDKLEGLTPAAEGPETGAPGAEAAPPETGTE